MNDERFQTSGGAPSLISDDRPGAQHVSILSDLAGAAPAGHPGGTRRGPALAAAGFAGVVAASLSVAYWSATDDARGAPSALPSPAALAGAGPAPSASVAADGDGPGAPAPDPHAAPLAAVIVDVPSVDTAPAQPASITAVAAGAAPVTAVRPPPRTAPPRKAARRPSPPPRRQAAPAAAADESDIDIITAIVRHASPEH